MNGDQAFNRLLDQRDLAWKQMLRSMGDALVVRGSGVVPTEEEPLASQYAYDLAGALAAPEFEEAKQQARIGGIRVPRLVQWMAGVLDDEPLREMRERNQRQAESKFHGIANWERMPEEDLDDLLWWRRELIRQEDSDEPMTVSRKLYETAIRSAVLLPTAGLQQTLRLVGNASENISFLSGPIARSDWMQATDQWLSYLREGFVADLPSEGGREIALGVTGAVGMFPAAYYTWALMGAAGAAPRAALLGRAVTPIGRGAIRAGAAMAQSGATELILQDPTAPLHERAVNLALGSALGLGDLGGVVGRSVTGVGLGLMAGVVADNDDPAVWAISAATGGLSFLAGGAALAKMQKNFPSRMLAGEFKARVAGAGRGPTRALKWFGGADPYAGSNIGAFPQGRYATPAEVAAVGRYAVPGEGGMAEITRMMQSESSEGLAAFKRGFEEGPRLGGARTVISDFMEDIGMLPYGSRGPRGPSGPGGAGAVAGPPPTMEDAIGTLEMFHQAGIPLSEAHPRLLEDFKRVIDRSGTAPPWLQNERMRQLQSLVTKAPTRHLFQGAGGTTHHEDMEADALERSLRKSLKLREADIEASQLNKQEAIMESPALAVLSNNNTLDDASVAQAIVASYPGQVGIVQNVNDAGGTLRRVLMDQMASGVGPQDFRVVERPVRTLPGTFYHGSSGLVGELTVRPGKVTWVDSDPAIANAYATYKEGAPAPSVTPVRLSPTKMMDFGRVPIAMGPSGDLLDAAREMGVDAVRFPDGRVAVLTSETLQPAFAAPRTTTDILVSSGRPITNNMVKEYEQHGMFSGQRVRLFSGQEAVIESLGPDGAVVKPLQGGPSVVAPLNNVLPLKSSHVVDDIPGLYEDFAGFAQNRLNQQALQSSIPLFPLLSNEGATQTALLMDEYIKGLGVDPTGYYGASLRWLMEQRHIEAIRALAPLDEQAFLKDLQAEYAAAVEERGLLPATLDDLAQARGFTVEDFEDGSIGLTDVYSKGSESAQFESEGAAREFLHTLQREPIDNSPVGGMPLEVMETPLGYSMIGGPTPGVYRDADHWLDHANDLLKTIEEPPAPPAGGGDGTPPVPPVGGDAGTPEGPEDDPWGAAFEGARKDQPEAFALAFGKLNNIVSKAYMPARNLMIRVDAALKPLGIPPFERMLVALQDGYIKTVNHAYGWEKQAFEYLHQLPREIRRDGTLWTIMNSDVRMWPELMDAAGMTGAEKQAVMSLQEHFMNFDLAEVVQTMPEIAARESFVNHFRRFEERLPGEGMHYPRQATWGPAGAETQGENWVAEKNVDAIVSRYFRAYYKTRYMNEPYKALQESVRYLPKDLQRVKDIVQGVSNARMWGLDPTEDFLIQTTHGLLDGLLKRFGFRVSIGEINSMFHAEMATSYSAGLAGRPDAIIRDMPQALIGIFHVGDLKRSASIFTRFVRDPAYRNAAQELAYDAGWAIRGHGAAVDPDIFSGGSYVALQPGGKPTISQLPGVERAVDWLSDNVLRRLGLQQGWQGTKFDLLRLYGWQSDWARVWNGMTGYETAHAALANFDAAKLAGELPLDQLERALLKESRVARFQGPIQDGFMEFVQKGDYEGAARYFGRHVSDSQNRYGMAEHPETWRNLGPATGRRAMKWLTFNSQQLANFSQIIADPRIEFGDKMAYFGQIGALQTLYGITQATTGWNMMKMSLLGIGFGTAGSSIFGMVNNWQRLQAWLSRGDPTSPGLTPDQAALLQAGRSPYGSTFFTFDPTRGTWNPYAGLLRTAGNLAESGEWGGEAVLRSIVTGQSGDPEVTRRQYGLSPYGNGGGYQQPMGIGPVPGEPSRAQLAPTPGIIGQSGQVSPLGGGYGGAAMGGQPSDTGASDPSRVYSLRGRPVYDTGNRTADGRVPTHAVGLPSGRMPGETWEGYEARVISTPDSAFPLEVQSVNNDIRALDPRLQSSLSSMVQAAQMEGIDLQLNEGLRPIQRQEWLFKEGRSPERGRMPVTWTLTSEHTNGRAADLRSSSQAGYMWIQSNAQRFGLSVLGMHDAGHVYIAEPQQQTGGNQPGGSY